MAKLGTAADANTPVRPEPELGRGPAEDAVHEPRRLLPAAHRQPMRVRQRVAAGAAVARPGVGHRQAGGAGRGPDRVDAQQVRRPDSQAAPAPRAGPEPVDRPGGPRQPAIARSSPTRAAPAARASAASQALLQYVFNQEQTINTFGPFGHMLAVDAFVNPMCSPYATPGRSRRTSRSTAPPTASATPGSAPTSRESTRPIRRTPPAACPIRAARLRARPVRRRPRPRAPRRR